MGERRKFMNIRNKRKLILFLLLVVLLTGFIFGNSLQSGEESNWRSGQVMKILERILDPQDRIPDETFHYFVRKGAHFIEFAALGWSLGGLFDAVGAIVKKRFISLPLLWSLMTAVTDEFIQSFGTRSSKVADVILDFSGACVGFGIMLAFLWILRKRSSCQISA